MVVCSNWPHLLEPITNEVGIQIAKPLPRDRGEVECDRFWRGYTALLTTEHLLCRRCDQETVLLLIRGFVPLKDWLHRCAIVACRRHRNVSVWPRQSPSCTELSTAKKESRTSTARRHLRPRCTGELVGSCAVSPAHGSHCGGTRSKRSNHRARRTRIRHLTRVLTSGLHWEESYNEQRPACCSQLQQYERPASHSTSTQCSACDSMIVTP